MDIDIVCNKNKMQTHQSRPSCQGGCIIDDMWHLFINVKKSNLQHVWQDPFLEKIKEIDEKTYKCGIGNLVM
jgi:hypothetical protein